MKIQPTTLSNIASLLGKSFIGDKDLAVTGINEIHVVTQGDVVFVDHPKYYDNALNSSANTIIINKEVECPKGKGLIISEDPFKDFNFLINFFRPFELNPQAVSDSAQIGNNCQIHSSAVIGNNVIIGDNTIIFPNVVIHDNCIIGNNVIIQSNCVIGGLGYYYKNRETHRERLNSGGRVIIDDYAEIGASTTIDKGVTCDTVIGKHTKIDNQVQVGHDTKIGDMCIIAAHVGIAGCTVIGNNVTLWGQVGVISGITIGDGATVLAQSGVGKSLDAGKTYFGSPADEARSKLREIAALKQVPSIIEKLNRD